MDYTSGQDQTAECWMCRDFGSEPGEDHKDHWRRMAELEAARKATR